MAIMNFGGVDENVVTRAEFPLEKAREVLKDDVIAVIGYGVQGPGQSLNLRDNGFNVIVGQRKDSKSWDKAVEDGWVPGETLFEIEEACEKATIIEYLLSDAGQISVWPTVKKHLTPGKALYFSHGFGITYKERTGIIPPADVDVILIAPKGSGTSLRTMFLEGRGLNSSYAIYQDATGKAWEKTIALGIGIGSGYLFETTFIREATSDLTGERGTLMGIKAGLDMACISHDLEKQVKALELKLQEYTDINQYYIDKYNKLFLDIKASRDEEIKQELENMAIEISVLRNKKDDLTKAVEDNKTIEKQLQELEAHLSELYHQMEVLTLDAESEITELEQIGLQTIEQHKEELNMFTKNLNELLIPPYSTSKIILLTSEIMMYLEKEGFNDVQTLKNNHRASLEIKKSCEEKNKEFEDAINQILIDKDSLIAKYREIENDDILHIQDEIAHFTIHQEKYREEMMASFEKIKLVHEEKITDKIRKFSVLGYPRKEIGELLDEDLDIFVQELLTLDSHENITYQKEKRLKKLIKEAERLKELNIEKETINQEYTALQQSFITKQKQVRVVEDYISKIHDMIDNNISRRNFAESYLNFMRFENEVKKLIEERQTTMSKLADDNGDTSLADDIREKFNNLLE